MYFERKFKFFKTSKNSYTGPISINDPKYECHDHQIRSFDQFLLQTGDFWKNRRLTPFDFEQKIGFF
jgi:hypothetical protein